MYEPRRVHPLAIIPTAIQFIKSLIIPSLVWITTQAKEHPILSLIIGVSVVTLVLLFGTLHWYNFTYSLQEGELRVHSGILRKKRRYVPLERIQSVDLTAGLLFQVLGLVKLQVETASEGKHPEITLAGIKRSVAEELKATLSAAKANAGKGKGGNVSDPAHTDNPASAVPPSESNELVSEPDFVPPEPPVVERRIANKELVFLALTSGKIGLIIPVLLSLSEYIGDLFRQMFRFVFAFSQSAALWQIILFGAVVLFVLAVGAVVMTLLSYGNFTVRRTARELKITHGLLERKELTLPLDRLQGIRIQESPLRQLFGYVTLNVESGGYGANHAQSTVLYPLIKRRKMGALLAELVPEFRWSEDLHPVQARAKRRYIFRLLLLNLLLVVPACLFIPNNYGWWSLLLLPLSVFWGALQHRDAGWAHREDCLTLRNRSFSRTTVVIPRRRIQSRHHNQTIFQKRVGLATCGVKIISGGRGKLFTIVDVDTTDLLYLK